MDDNVKLFYIISVCAFLINSLFSNEIVFFIEIKS